MASLGIGFDEENYDSLSFRETSDQDYGRYVYPYMLTYMSPYTLFTNENIGDGLFSAGFWRDENWMVCLF